MDPTAAALHVALVAVVLPVWLLAGVADWACHRALRIEHSTGWPESVLHLAMLVELGVGILAALLFMPTPLMIALLFVLCLAHDATMAADIVYAERRRRIPPPEQWVHGLQHAMPWVAWGAWSLAGWNDTASGIVGRNDTSPAAWLIVGFGGACVAAAFLEEAGRTRRGPTSPG